MTADKPDPESAELRQLRRLLVPISNLPAHFQDQILQKAEVIELKRRDRVFEQGDRDNFTFYLLQGVVELSADDQLIKRVEGGTAAAFHPLAQLQPRQMSAICTTAAKVLRVDRQLLDKLLSMAHGTGEGPLEGGSEIEVTEIETGASVDWMAQVLQSELFSRIPSANVQKLFATMEQVVYKAGDAVVRQGEPGDYYYIIQSGRCAVSRRVAASGQSIKLAELGPGDSFGEEALVAEAKRNATVTLLTPGELVRLTKNDFIELIKKPILHSVRLEEARAMVAKGAQWVDVRFADEHKESGIPGSLNLPLGLLRVQAEKLLDHARPCVLYCDSGVRSSIGAFLLVERGFDAVYVEGGCLHPPVPVAAPRPKPTAAGADPAIAAASPPPGPPPAPRAAPATAVPVPGVSSNDSAFAASLLASKLQEELAKAQIQLQHAMRLKAEAEAAKLAAEQVLEEKLRSERGKLEVEAKRATEALSQAERMKSQLEAAQQAAALEAERYSREQEEALLRMRAESEARLREGEAKIEALYARNAEELERMQSLKTAAETRLQEERHRLDKEALLTRDELAAARRREEQLEAEARRLIAEQEASEQELREGMSAQLAEERRRFEAAFAKSQEQLAEAQREKQEAELAQRNAALEAQRIIAEYKTTHEQHWAQEMAKLQADRERLNEEAGRLRIALDEARRAKAEAEASRRAAERQVEQLRAEQQAMIKVEAEAKHVQIEAEIEAIEVQAERAARRYREAVAAQEVARKAQIANEVELGRTSENLDGMRKLLQEELDEWLCEQEHLQERTSERELLLQQANLALRARQQAEDKQRLATARNQSLIEDLASQLHKG